MDWQIQKQLMDAWFDGKYALEVKPEEFDLFANYIRFYERNFNIDPITYKTLEKPTDTIYCVWKFSKDFHNYKVKFETGKNYWKKPVLEVTDVKETLQGWGKAWGDVNSLANNDKFQSKMKEIAEITLGDDNFWFSADVLNTKKEKTKKENKDDIDKK